MYFAATDICFKFKEEKMLPEDRNFRYETDQEFSKADYVIRRVIVRAIFLIIVLAIIGFAVNWFTVKTNRKIFKHSDTYTETAAQFLAKEYKEYNEAEDEAEREAIMEYVSMRYPNLDSEDIDNHDLRRFYKECIS